MRKTLNDPGCDFVRNNLFSYHENKLSLEEKHVFEDHLYTCNRCKNLSFNFNSVTTLINSKRDAAPDPFIQTRTLQKITSVLEGGNKSYFAFSKRTLQPLVLSSIFFAAVVIGFALGKQVDSEFSMNLSRQYDIQFMKSDLYITDFMDEDNVFVDNH